MNNIMSIFDLNLDISDKINKEVIKLNIVKEKQKENKIELVEHINMINDLADDFLDVIKKDENSVSGWYLEYRDFDMCREYDLEVEYERLENERFVEYYGL